MVRVAARGVVVSSMVSLAQGERWSKREAIGGGSCVNGAKWSTLGQVRDGETYVTASDGVAFSGPRRNSRPTLGRSLKPGLSNTAKRGNRSSAGDKGRLGTRPYMGSTPVGHRKRRRLLSFFRNEGSLGLFKGEPNMEKITLLMALKKAGLFLKGESMPIIAAQYKTLTEKDREDFKGWFAEEYGWEIIPPKGA